MKINESGNVEYTTAEIQKMYGMSNKGLFYYEDKELITPQRLEENQYRVYTLKETARLHRCRVFRQYGFPVNEVVGYVSHCTGAELASGLARRMEAIDREMQWMALVKREIEENVAAIGRISEGNIPFEVVTRPPMFRMTMRAIGELYTQREQTLYQLWQSYIPLAAASLRVEDQALRADAGRATISLGFIISAAHVGRLKEELASELVYLPPVKCVHTIVHGSDDQLGTIDRFTDALRRLEQSGQRVTGMPVTRMIATLDNGRGMERFDHAWLPVGP